MIRKSGNRFSDQIMLKIKKRYAHWSPMMVSKGLMDWKCFHVWRVSRAPDAAQRALVNLDAYSGPSLARGAADPGPMPAL
jgi:hypothetical protein